MIKDDWSAEDDASAEQAIDSAATGEFKRFIDHLKYQDRRAKLLYMRSLGRNERIRLKAEYGWT